MLGMGVVGIMHIRTTYVVVNDVPSTYTYNFYTLGCNVIPALERQKNLPKVT